MTGGISSETQEIVCCSLIVVAVELCAIVLAIIPL